MNDCDFCNGKIIDAEGTDGDGIRTMSTMLDSLWGMIGGTREKEEKHKLMDGIQLRYGNVLMFESSSGEYVPQGLEIKYCPFCGVELKAEENDD